MSLTRRRFVQSSLAAASLPFATSGRVLGANDELRVAVIGLRGRGRTHIAWSLGEAEAAKVKARIVAISDADDSFIGGRSNDIEKQQKSKPDGHQDYREIMDRKDVDIVSIATPNHWHALMAIQAMESGKDVYVEKPVSHNVWEGRQIVNASKKYGKICQTGTQIRSQYGVQQMIKYVQEGQLGKIKYVVATCHKARRSIGKRDTPLDIPQSVNYDLWCGPAEKRDLFRNSLHYDWHWDYNTGNGDLGNQGIHQMDVARWFLGVNELSPAVFSVGGRLGYEDAGDTANTQLIYHEYAAAPLIFTVRGLPAKYEHFKDGKWGNQHMGNGFRDAGNIGVVAVCEGGWMAVNSYSSGRAYDNDGKKIKSFSGGGDHYANFYKAVQSRKREDLNADILEGHLSSALCHTGNVSHLLGKTGASAGEIEERFAVSEAGKEAVGRLKDHLAELKLPFNGNLTLGPRLTMDPKTERFTGDWADKANPLLSRPYRKPFVVPDLG